MLLCTEGFLTLACHQQSTHRCTTCTQSVWTTFSGTLRTVSNNLGTRTRVKRVDVPATHRKGSAETHQHLDQGF